jgi:uncharacterized protein YkwD
MIMDTQRITVATSALLACVILSGCADSGSEETSSSSTTDTNYQTAYRGNHSWWHRRTNHPPYADINANEIALPGETVTLDGSITYDPDGDELYFTWSQISGPSVTLSDTAGSTLTFIAPEATAPTQMTFQLIVSDGRYSSSTHHTLQVTPALDTLAPVVITRSPAQQAQNVATDTKILVSFNEALSESSIDASALQLTQSSQNVNGTLSYDSANQRILFKPSEPLQSATRYQITLGDGLMDLAGNSVAPESWVFTTVTGKTPDDGSDTDNDSSYNLGNTSQETIDGCMDDSDKLMLTLINNARAQQRSCGTTSYASAPALAWHCQLKTAATNHSKSMAEEDYFSHTDSDGNSPGDRITAAGYRWRTYGENIAAGYRDEQAVMDGWLSSPGHCANIMNATFTEVGAGKVNGGGYYGIYWTQDFATPN